MSSIIAIIIIKAYRLIPAPVRSIWSLGKRTSHLGLAAAQNGAGLRSFHYAFHWISLPANIADLHGEGNGWWI